MTFTPTRGSALVLPGLGPAGAKQIPSDHIDRQINALDGLEFWFDGLSLVSPDFLCVDRKGDRKIVPTVDTAYPSTRYDEDAPGGTTFEFPSSGSGQLICMDYQLPASFSVVHVCTPLDHAYTGARSLFGYRTSIGDRVIMYMTQTAPGNNLTYSGTTIMGSATNTSAVIVPGAKVVTWAAFNAGTRRMAIGWNGAAANSSVLDRVGSGVKGVAIGDAAGAWKGSIEGIYVFNRTLHSPTGGDAVNAERASILALIGGRHGVSW